MRRKIDLCLDKKTYEEFALNQDLFNEKMANLAMAIRNEISDAKTVLDFDHETLDKQQQDIDQVKDKQLEVITREDLIELSDALEVKADKKELMQL